MTSTPTIPPLTGTITVDAPIDQTFRTFTDSFGRWCGHKDDGWSQSRKTLRRCQSK
jgi:hypothetical protein